MIVAGYGEFLRYELAEDGSAGPRHMRSACCAPMPDRDFCGVDAVWLRIEETSPNLQRHVTLCDEHFYEEAGPNERDTGDD